MSLKSRLSSRLHIHNGFHPPLWKFLSSSESESTFISACNVYSADNLDNRVHRFLKEQGVGSEMAEAIMGIISSIGMANFETMSLALVLNALFSHHLERVHYIYLGPYDKCCLQLEAAMMVHHSKEII